MDTLARIGFNPAKKYFQLGDVRRDRIILGGGVSEDRPGNDRDTDVTAYWNTSRLALRLRSPDPIKPWRTIAQGFLSDEELESIGQYAALRTPERSVVFVAHAGGTAVFINLPNDEGELRWRQLRVRAEHNLDAIWNPQTYVRTTETQPTVTTDAGETKTVSNEKTLTETDSKFETVKKVLATETQQALWRSAATQVTRTARDLFLASAKKAMPKQKLVINQIGKVLCTPMGEAAFGYALGVALEIKAEASDVRRKRLASELRIGGEAAALNVVINPIREFFTGGIDTILNGIDGLALPDVAPAPLPGVTPTETFDGATQREHVHAQGSRD